MSCQLSTTQVQENVIRANNGAAASRVAPTSPPKDAGVIQSNVPIWRELFIIRHESVKEALTLTAIGARQGSFFPIRKLGEIEILTPAVTSLSCPEHLRGKQLN